MAHPQSDKIDATATMYEYYFNSVLKHTDFLKRTALFLPFFSPLIAFSLKKVSFFFSGLTGTFFFLYKAFFLYIADLLYFGMPPGSKELRELCGFFAIAPLPEIQGRLSRITKDSLYLPTTLAAEKINLEGPSAHAQFMFRVQSSPLLAMDAPLSDRIWDSLRPPLSRSCLAGVKRLGFRYMTPVQSATIPYFLQNKDVAVEAITGSGKTLAFVLPIIEILSRRPEPWSPGETGALVVTPTRELATQIASVMRPFVRDISLSLSLLIGGKDIQENIADIATRGANLIVATPGRLVDVLSRQDCNLASSVRSLEVLVLDEADRLLELGFEQSINTVLSYLPKQRRTGLFSATLNQDVKALIRAGMRNPVTITVKDKQTSTDLAPTPKSLSNFYLVCEAERKVLTLFTVLRNLDDRKVIVFFATCASVSYFGTLTKRLFPELNVMSLHGKMHSKRQKLFTQFSSCSCGCLMCTDVMARGVDFPSVDWVIQFDPPSCTKSFVHRCGRTARMGRKGQALVMLLPSETPYVEFLSLNQHITLDAYELEDSVDNRVLTKARDLGAKERLEAIGSVVA